ncbi:MAG: hypothetical protein U0791_07240 [Gemmataceae bacterium]
MFGLQAGSIVDVDGASCVVKYVIPGDPCESETWAILMPVSAKPAAEAGG